MYKRQELLRNEEGVALDNVRSFKYWPDPDAVGEANGNDIVYEYQGEEYLAAQMDYTLGKILEKHID